MKLSRKEIKRKYNKAMKLHIMFDILCAEYATETMKLYSETNLIELMIWSSKRIDKLKYMKSKISK